MYSRDQSRTVDEFVSPRHSFSADIVLKGGADLSLDRPIAQVQKAKCAFDMRAPSLGAILPSLLSSNGEHPNTAQNYMNMDLEDSKDLINALWELREACYRSGESPLKVGRCQSAVTKLV